MDSWIPFTYTESTESDIVAIHKHVVTMGDKTFVGW